VPVNVAIVGPAGSGKTTLFKALTAGRGADGVGMVDVPDERLQRLADAVKPLKVTPAQVRVEDTPPGSRAQRVAFARQSDVLVKVARCFGPDPQPAAELEEFVLDLVLADLASVERRLEAVAKEVRAGKKDATAENDVLQLAKAHLDAGQPLRTLALEREQRDLLKGVFPVTLKPTVYIANAADELLPGGGEPAAKVRELAAREHAPAIVLSARLEAELGELEVSEQAGPHSEGGMGGGRSHHLFHRRRAGGPSLAVRARRAGAGRRGQDPHGFREALHPRRGDLRRRARGGGIDGGAPRRGQASRRRALIHREGRRRRVLQGRTLGPRRASYPRRTTSRACCPGTPEQPGLSRAAPIALLV
jgi:hypothetical protein